MSRLWKGRTPSKNLLSSRWWFRGGPGVDSGNCTPFPGVDQAEIANPHIRDPPRSNEPRERTLINGSIVKWCGLCGKWADNYCAGHPTEEPEANEGFRHVATETMDAGDDIDDEPAPGAFAHHRVSGLI